MFHWSHLVNTFYDNICTQSHVFHRVLCCIYMQTFVSTDNTLLTVFRSVAAATPHVFGLPWCVYSAYVVRCLDHVARHVAVYFVAVLQLFYYIHPSATKLCRIINSRGSLSH